MAEAAAVSIHNCGHELPHEIEVFRRGTRSTRHDLLGPVAKQRMLNTHGDPQEATEWGASGVAAIVVETFAKMTVIERVPKNGKGVDYLLAPTGECNLDDENFMAVPTHQLEVSGTLQHRMGEMDERVKEKIKRINDKPQLLPTLVVVVDFHRVRARMVKA